MFEPVVLTSSVLARDPAFAREGVEGTCSTPAVISTGLVEAATRLAQESGTSINQVITAAVRALLARYERALDEEAEGQTFRALLQAERHRGEMTHENGGEFRIGITWDRPDDLGCDVTLALDARAEQLCGTWYAQRRVLNESDLERLNGHFGLLFAKLIAQPDAGIAEHNLLDISERRCALEEWNRTASDYPRDSSIAELFREAVERDPSAVAVVDGEVRLTYRELDRRSNQVAHRLLEQGVEPETLVGVALPRSAGLIVALLGVLKAGAGYVPLDLNYPPERLSFMVQDTAIRVLIAEEGRAQLSGLSEARILDIGSAGSGVGNYPDVPVAAGSSAKSTAYVMYTSGSTGVPKGVEVPQRAVIRLVRNTSYVEFGPGEVFAQISSASFDALTFEVWGALLHGARVVILSDDQILTPRRFAAAVAEHKLSAMFLTSALFNVLAREVPECFAGIRHAVVGGDAVDPRWARHVLQISKVRRLINGYGPTECTTFAVTHPICEVAEGAALVPIGRPIANTQAFVLDRRLRVVPVGVPGELYLAGDGLAKGYWRAPDLTAEKFVFHSFEGAQGVRLYRTGDLARYRADGVIEHLGRRDDQVKIRGFRIELGEITAALRSCPGVSDCVIVARQYEETGKTLCAYVSSSVASLKPAELRRFLEGRLPSFAVPSFVVVLDRLPLSANGKICREKLPDPRTVAQEESKVHNEVEGRVRKIWQIVLGVPEPGADSNFFDVGGNSLLMVSLAEALNREFGASLSITDLFGYSTIREQAKRLEQTGLVQEEAVRSDARRRAQAGAAALARLRKVRPLVGVE